MAETKIGLNTGFETSQAGMSKASRIALNTSVPSAMADDSGILKRKVLEPDQFPSVSLETTSPHMDEYPNRGDKPMSDGVSKTA